MTQKNTFKKCCVIGLLCFFISLFVEWYSFHIYDLSHEPILSGHYSLLFGWSMRTPQPQVAVLFAVQYKLPDLFFIALISPLVILLALYFILFKDIEVDNTKEEITFGSWTLIGVWILLIVYLFVLPVLFFIPKGFYVPFAYYEDSESHTFQFCVIGLGYILQIIAFIFITPYVAFHYQTSRRFEKQGKVLENIILNNQEHLSFDKLLAEEEVKLASSLPS